jgi:hypothetical protein
MCLFYDGDGAVDGTVEHEWLGELSAGSCN